MRDAMIPPMPPHPMNSAELTARFECETMLLAW